jgi:hypothetical protein
MLEIIGGAVALLLVGPPLLVIAAVGLLMLAGMLPDGSRQLRKTFYCPWKKRLVTAHFVVPKGAGHPSELTRCSAFAVPTRITCGKPCRRIAYVRWGLSRTLFPRWALTAGGPTTWREARLQDTPG